MIEAITRFLKKRQARRKMPKRVKDWWYSGEWYMYRCDEQSAGRPYKVLSEPLIPLPPYEGKFMFSTDQLLGQSHFVHKEEAGSSTASSNGLPLVAAIKVDGFVGWYRVTRRHGKSSWYDGAGWDDGYKADLVLVDVTEIAS